MRVLVFDTETTGLPVRAHELDPSQPWPIQLGAITMDLRTGTVEKELNTVMCPPEGVFFDPRAVAVHGITEERARDEGRDSLEVLQELQDMARGSMVISAYNLPFDERIIRTSSIRLHPHYEEDLILGKHALHYCIMQQATQAFGSRQKLVTIYRKLTGKELEDAHDAMADTYAAAEVFRILSAKKLQQS